MPHTDLLHVPADIGQVLGILRAADVTGILRDYAESRMAGAEVSPDLALAAFKEAQHYVDEAESVGHKDTSLDGVSVNILKALMLDIKSYAKLSASRSEIVKLAKKFEKALG